MRRKSIIMLVVSMIVVFVLSPFWASGRVVLATQGQIKNPNIILASGLGPPYIQHAIAVERGFMKRYGLNAQLRVFSGGLDAVRAVGSGVAQVSNAGELSTLSPRSRGADYLAVGGVLVNTSDLGVAVARGISGPKDLVGKRCAVQLGGSGEYYAYRFMVVYKINPTAIKLINMQPPEWIPALVRGDVDCFFGWEPWLTQLPSILPGAKVIHLNGQDKVYVVQQTLLFNGKWVKEDPEAAKAALRGMIDTLSWLNTHRSDAAAIGAKAFQTDAAELEQQMTCCVYRVLFSQDQVDSLTEVARWGVERGLFENVKADQLLKDLLFPDLLKGVSPERCTATICRGTK